MVVEVPGETTTILEENATDDLNSDVPRARRIQNGPIGCCGKNCRARFLIGGAVVGW